MFTKFHIRNFRTHVDTEISLTDMTLIIGGNNSGKTNLLEALRFFSRLMKESFDESEGIFINEKHSLNRKNSMSFDCEWIDDDIKIAYNVKIDTEGRIVNIIESLKIIKNDEGNKEYKKSSSHIFKAKLYLLGTINQKEPEYWEIATFFQELASLQYYNFQPFLLKQEAKNYSQRINIVKEIGKEGANFQSLVKYIKENEDETYNKFVGFLRRFEESFVGIKIENEQVKWQFDMGNSNFPAFVPEKVSEGLLKAGAIALLCAMKNPPSIIMIEEVENGINQKNLAEFLKWLINASENGKNTQFILTSHSPSVIREFADRIDTVYNVHLKKKKGYISEVTNLNEALKPLVRFGAIKEESVFEENGLVHIRPHALTELFYNGILGEL